MENGTKFRILYLYQYLVRYSDAEHPVSTVELIRMLKEKHNIDVNRNTIGKDLDIMNQSGLHIEVIRSTQNKYYFDGQLFDLAEIKILMDAISSSKFITERKSEELITKLLSLTNEHGANKLRRHMFVSGRVKSDNEKGYYIVDAINEAIDTKRKISFQYTEHNQRKERVLRHNGESYVISPYALMWDGDYYYLIGYNEKRSMIQNFRLDRIFQQPLILEEFSIPAPESFDLSAYSKSVFRMYGTNEISQVTLLCENFIVDAVIDNFGLDVSIEPVDENHFLAHVDVYASPTFYRWIFGWNGGIKIIEPYEIKECFNDMLKKQLYD